jgi:elongation factor Ts
VAAEGLVGMRLEDRAGALVEINSETDFVARNETFQTLVRQVADLASRAEGDLERLRGMTIPETGRTVADEITQAVAVIGENLNLRRTAYVAVSQGVVAGYMHSQTVPGLGRIGVLIGLESAADPERLAEVGKQLAMHVAATNPQALDVASLDPAVVERERQVYADQARATGKPENIIEKMVEGRMRKFYEEAVLLEQAFVVDPDRRVKQVVEGLEKEVGQPVKVTAFARLALGEGVTKEDNDLAAEVAKMTQG